MLAANKKTAVFFLLGEDLKSRLRETNAAKLAAAYQGQCVASHGWEHRSHAASEVWKDGRTWESSVTDTQALMRSAFAAFPGLMPLFRPPYGERRSDSSAFFQKHSLRVALWDLDSQDWNPKVTADDVTSRIETLMLIKRHGILLFHDTFPKAKSAVPAIIQDFAAAVEWGNCRQITEAY
jgi:peptidoglycan/xylan/chitin deacetylase (PgdA/CDA1 family)